MHPGGGSPVDSHFLSGNPEDHPSRPRTIPHAGCSWPAAPASDQRGESHPSESLADQPANLYRRVCTGVSWTDFACRAPVKVSMLQVHRPTTRPPRRPEPVGGRRHRRPVSVSVCSPVSRGLRSARPPLRGAVALDAGSAHARPDWPLDDDAPSDAPSRNGRRTVRQAPSTTSYRTRRHRGRCRPTGPSPRRPPQHEDRPDAPDERNRSGHGDLSNSTGSPDPRSEQPGRRLRGTSSRQPGGALEDLDLVTNSTTTSSRTTETAYGHGARERLAHGIYRP